MTLAQARRKVGAALLAVWATQYDQCPWPDPHTGLPAEPWQVWNDAGRPDLHRPPTEEHPVSRTLSLRWTRTEYLYAEDVEVTEKQVREHLAGTGDPVASTRPLIDEDYLAVARDTWADGPADLGYEDKDGGDVLDAAELVTD